MKILETIRGISASLPTLIIDIVSGGAGMFMPAPGSRSAASSLMAGDFEGAFHAAGYNYVGVDTYGTNGFGLSWKRAAGLKVALVGQLFKAIYNDLKGVV